MHMRNNTRWFRTDKALTTTRRQRAVWNTSWAAAAAWILFVSMWNAGAAERIVLVAGGGTETNKSTPLLPTHARLNAPFGVDFDRAGNLYLVEMLGQHVRRLDPAGRLSIIAGTGEKGAGGDDGPARDAQFNGMHNLAV